MAGAGTLETLATALGRMLAPLERHLQQGDVLGLFEELGLKLPPSLLARAGFIGAIGSGAGGAARLSVLVLQIVEAVEDEREEEIADLAPQLIEQIVIVVEALDEIAGELNAASGSLPEVSPADVEALAAELPERLLDYLAVVFLESYVPVALNAGLLIGLIEMDFDTGDETDPSKPPFTRRKLRLDRIPDLLRSPEEYVKTVYDWGNPGFDGSTLLPRIHGLLASTGVPVSIEPPTATEPLTLRWLLLSLSPDLAANPPGLEATLRLPIEDGLSLEIPLFKPGWSAVIEAKGRLEAALGAKVGPPARFELVPPSGSVSGSLTFGFKGEPVAPATALVIFGQAGGTRLEAKSVRLSAGGSFSWDSASAAAKGDVLLEGQIEGGRAVISMAGSDGFLAQVLPPEGFGFDFDVLVAWSESTGLVFRGAGALETAIPLHLELGPVALETLYLRLGVGTDGLITEVSIAGGFDLGVLAASVDRIGLAGKLKFEQGNLGPADLQLAFKPPNGVGLAVNAGVVKGGGYLFFDFEAEEYAGALELVIAEFLHLTAIGLITTRMPDGSRGFSLLVIITAEFGSGIQLGYGFTLLGVGGLLGLNRTMRLQPLMEGVRTGAINGIMFPRDVVANAPRIISDLKTIFPPQEGVFLIGPMAKLGWGTPTLVSVAVGVIIEIPGNVAIIGVIQVALPTPEEGIVVIQVNFAGAIEFDRKRVYFFAALFESRILFMTLEGEMALLAAFGDDADFVLSVGGFHPSFKPPPLPVPTPRRLALSILNEPMARIRAETYLAVTTNTAQLGARAELFFGFSAFGIKGDFGFDALLQFSPFYFIIELSASLSVQVFGVGAFSVRVHMSLEGPTPWRAQGTGSISMLFFDFDVDFEHTWGEERATELPPVEVMPLLLAEVEKRENWRALLPSTSNLLVSLRQLDSDETGLVLHPLGSLQLSQRAVPLDLTLDKIGAQRAADGKRFSLAAAGGGLDKSDDVFEAFAPAQFRDFDDAAKLSQPAYERYHGGIELAPSDEQLSSGAMVRRVVRYELVTIDTGYRRFLRRFHVFSDTIFIHLLAGSSVARSPLSQHAKSQLQPHEEVIKVAPESFVVASQADNTPHAAEAVFSSKAMAQDYLANQLDADPNLADSLHVIDGFEAVV